MPAIIFETTGGPEVLRLAEPPLAAPGPGEVLVRHTAIGLNFIDTYHRSGLYPVPLPSGLGLEAAGVVEAAGAGVALTPGTRVAYCSGPLGAYADRRVMPAATLVPLPDDVADDVAAAAMLKGCTTEMLVERCARVQPGEVALVHAAAGGVGLLLVQWLKAVGATVIAVAGSDAKVALATGHGADHGLVDGDGLAAAVHDLTGGRGVDVVFDGVGAATFERSLDCLKRRGLMVSYGNASGAVTGVALGILARKGSLFVTRPTMFDYYSNPAEVAEHTPRLWSMLASGKLRVSIDQRYPLAAAADAHRDLEARRTTGATVLLP